MTGRFKRVPHLRDQAEKGNVENELGEFRKFLDTSLDGDARAERTIVDIRQKEELNRDDSRF